MGTTLSGTTPQSTYPALIKVGDNSALSATLKTLSDGAGNDLPMQVSTSIVNFTGNVGVGTTNPTARLRVISADTNGIAEFFQNGNTSSPLHLTRYTGLTSINLNSAAGGSASPVPVGDGIQLSRITTNTYNGTAFAASTRIEVITKGIQSATNYGSNMRFQITPENNINLYTSLALLSDGNVQIGADYNVALGAKLAIKGTGSTSATTSLLVQNSAGTESLKVQDDNIVRTTYLGIGGGTSTNNIGGTHIAQFGNAISAGDQIIVVDSVNGSKRGFKFGNQGTIRMALIQNDANLQIGNYAILIVP